jgi:hypothetical protein
MQRPSSQWEKEFERFRPALPPQWEERMRALGVLTYARKISSPQERLCALLLYCRLDQS